ALYGVNLGLRAGSLDAPRIDPGPLLISCIAFGTLGFSGYLGGRMVYDEGIGVGKHRRRTNIPDETVRVSTRSPEAEESSESILVPVPQAQQLRDRENLRLEIDGTAMVVLKAEGKFYAFQDFCTHRFGPLSEGSYQAYEVECPWHRSCFDVRTGKVVRGPAKTELKTFRVELREGKLWVALPRAPQPPSQADKNPKP
ncbi:MAG TPA: Rieske 2Fe-2S domain-containing protein, partial [Clostridia bacterium]|nr:Rieske 2Fe-2S domain-containing protein [Clostridia bacterium]